MGYLPGMWHDFGVAIGGLAGALTGLLFVPSSECSQAIMKTSAPACR
jgi:gas vesicle protein